MKVSKSQLKNMILSEYRKVVAEKKFKQDSPSNPYHSSDGTFTGYGDSRSWSLEDKQREMKSGKNVKPCGRGQRRKCKSPQELKWEGSEEPRSDSTSEFRRDDPRYENQRQKNARNFPGYESLKKLSLGIINELFDEMEAGVAEHQADKHCFSTKQLRAFKDKAWKKFLNGVAAYEKASKGED